MNNFLVDTYLDTLFSHTTKNCLIMLWVFILFCLWLNEGSKYLCFTQKLLLNHSIERLNNTQFKKTKPLIYNFQHKSLENVNKNVKKIEVR